jgi:sulfur relay protein TusB/DsrH
VIDMVESVLFLTSKNGADFYDLIQTASSISDSGSHVRVLLIGDAVLSAVRGSASSLAIQHASPPIDFLVCEEDLETRGLTQKTDRTIRALSYDEIVDLLMTNDDRIASYV